MSCAICLDGFALPVALPCGHVFCQSCLVNSIIASPDPACPTCRRPYPTATLDPSCIPPSLRPYILPPFRRLYLDNACPRPAPSTSTSAPPTSAPPHPPTSALAAENAALRTNLRRLRARAEQHAAARVAAAAFARATAACALAERGRLARLKWRVRAYAEGRGAREGWDGEKSGCARAMVIPDTGEAASLWQGGTGVGGM